VQYVKDKGEIGGVFARSTNYRWFADTSIDTKNRTQTLHLAGNLRMDNVNFEGTFRIGYFNTNDPATNFVGIEIREPMGTPITPMVHNTGKLLRAYLFVNGLGGVISTVPLELDMNFLGVAFDLIWKGNADGSGTLSGTVASRPVSITVAAGSSSFNAFGILSGGNDNQDSGKKTGECYFDNLNYDKSK
jgi:hypothetical protein